MKCETPDTTHDYDDGSEQHWSLHPDKMPIFVLLFMFIDSPRYKKRKRERGREREGEREEGERERVKERQRWERKRQNRNEITSICNELVIYAQLVYDRDD